jgi:hypothetical protein
MTIYELLSGHIDSLDRLLLDGTIASTRERGNLQTYREKIVKYRDGISVELAETELGDWPLPHA